MTKLLKYVIAGAAALLGGIGVYQSLCVGEKKEQKPQQPYQEQDQNRFGASDGLGSCEVGGERTGYHQETRDNSGDVREETIDGIKKVQNTFGRISEFMNSLIIVVDNLGRMMQQNDTRFRLQTTTIIA